MNQRATHSPVADTLPDIESGDVIILNQRLGACLRNEGPQRERCGPRYASATANAVTAILATYLWRRKS